MDDVQKLFAIIVMNDDETVFQNKLKIWVPAILTRLDNPDPETRKVGLDVVNHLLKRIRALGVVPNPDLTFSSLFNCIKTTDHVLTVHLTLTFLRLQFAATPNLSLEDLHSGVQLLGGISSRVSQNRLPLASFLVRLLPQLHFAHGNAFLDSLALSDADSTLLIDLFRDLMLLPPDSDAEVTAQRGLSKNRVKELYKHFPKVKLKELSRLRHSVLKLLTFCPKFGATRKFIVFAISSVASTEMVQSFGDNEAKKMQRDVNFEDPGLIKDIYGLWMGVGGKKTPVDDKRPAVGSNLRLALLRCLQRSVRATNTFPQQIKLVFECLHGASTFPRMQQAGVEFLCWCLTNGNKRKIKPFVQVYQQGLMKIINKQDRTWEGARLRGMAYGALALLCNAVPSHFVNSLELFNMLLNTLVGEESAGNKQCIKDALRMIRATYKGASATILENLNESLRMKLEDPELKPLAIYVCIDWLLAIFPFSNSKVRLTCLHFLRYPDGKIADLAEKALLPQISMQGLEPYPDFADFVSKAFEEVYQLHKAFSDYQLQRLLKFSRQCFNSCVKMNKLSADEEWEKFSDVHNAFYDICQFALDKFPATTGSGLTVHSVALSCLNSFNGLQLSPRFVEDKFVLQCMHLTIHDGSEAQIEASKLLHLVVPHASDAITQQVVQTFTNLLQDTGNSSSAEVEGAVRGLGQVLGAITTSRELAGPELDSLRLITEMLFSAEETLLSACVAARACALHRPLQLSTDETERAAEISRIMKQCLKLVRENLTNRRDISEAAVEVISGLAKGERNVDILTEIRKELVTLENVKEEDVQFALGDAVTNIVTNDACKDTELDFMIDYCAGKTATGSALQRQASCVWLLNITRASKEFPEIQKHLPRIQDAFLPLLAESRQFTSECAAKGLAFCYESGDPAMKASLVENLRYTFSKGRRIVRDNTDMETSGGMKTFRELSSIAKEMRRPNLLYQLLDIAGTHAAWTSKRGAAFSLGSLLRTCDELAPQLDSLIPKLFRYKFDPNSLIKTTMSQLWSSLVKQPQQAIMTHYDKIMKDLMKSIKSKETRVKISSCAALVDLLDGRRFEEIRSYWLDLWKLVLDVLDHTHEQVLKTAQTLAMKLQNMTQRMCDPKQSSPEVVQQMLDIMMSFCIKGFEHEKKMYRFFTIMTTLQIIDVTKEYLVPYLPDVMRTIVEAIGKCEPQFFAWLSAQQLSSSEKDQLDQIRDQQSKHNPLYDALWKCERIMTSEAAESVIREVLRVINRNIGFGAVQASTRLLDNLLTGGFKNDVVKHRKKIMSVMCRVVKGSKSGSMTKMYASVLAKTCALSDPEVAGSLIDLASELFVKEGGIKTALAICKALTTHAHQKLPTHGKFYAVVFVGCCHEDKATKTSFEEILTEMGGNYIILAKYSPDVMKLVYRLSESQIYKTCKLGYATVDRFVAASGSKMAPDEGRQLLEFLTGNVRGHIWEGKHILFKSISSLMKHCPHCFTQEDFCELLQFLQEQILRTNIDFQCSALNCLTEVMEEWSEPGGIELLATTLPILEGLLNTEMVQYSDDTFETRMEKGTEINNLKCCALRTMGKLWRVDQSRDAHEEFAEETVAKFHKEFLACHWTVKIALLRGLEDFLTHLLVPTEFGPFVDSLCEFGLGAERMPVRFGSVKCLHALLTYKRISNGSHEVMKIIIACGQVMSSETKDVVKTALNNLLEASKLALGSNI